MARKSRFLLGAALGAAAGILFAPKSGKATRAKLKQESKTAYRKARSTGAKTISSAKKVQQTVTRDAKKVAVKVAPAKKATAKKSTSKKKK